jgi:feruloyl-CoA synthase
MSNKVALSFGPPDVTIDRRSDGSMIVRSTGRLKPYVRAVPDWLEHWARETPNRVFLGERQGEVWREVTYAEARKSVRNIAQSLLNRGLSAERPVAILSGNSIDHALVGLGAMMAGLPYAPVSPPYSLVAKDFAKLRAIIDNLTPGLVFVNDGAPFQPAIDAVLSRDVEVVAGRNPPSGRASCLLAELLLTDATGDVDEAYARIKPETIGKILYTSGSTGVPKGVVNTHRMMTSNQAMLHSVNPSFAEEAPVLLEWLPWSHTFGGNNNFNLVLSCGGSLYVDEGRPLPGAIEKTIRNLREISPTVYYNVPKGFEMLLPYLQQDEALRHKMFARLQAFVYAGAALPPHVRSELERLTRETVGHAIPVLTSLGSTETGPSALSVTAKACEPGVVGIPNPGVELKLIPNGGKLEARLKSPSITPGYWRMPEQTKKSYDEEGYYLLGDALKFKDEQDPQRGLVFDGRVAEDFKLVTGTWVSVGPLRMKFVAHFEPYVTDLVVAGHDRDDVAALVVPNYVECRALAPDLPKDASYAEIVASPRVREEFVRRLAVFNAQAGGSSERFKRILLLDDPPSLDSGELTDKGSINQRAALALRTEQVEELYAPQASARVIS